MNSTKTALLIGGTKGMALETAKHLAHKGVNLILVARDQAGLDAAEKSLHEDSSVTIETYAADLYNSRSVTELIDTITARKSSIDYLINAAGYFNPLPFLDFTTDDYCKYMDLNESTFFITQAVAKNMKQHSGGAIVNIGSMWAK